MENKREFFVETPMGKLRIWAKCDNDNMTNYPGVYIDFISNGEPMDVRDDYMTAVVEYDSVKNCIQTCVYQPWSDEPVAIIERDSAEEVSDA